jgi:hypothetical protein
MAGDCDTTEALAAILDAAVLAAEAEGISAEAAKRLGTRICERIQRQYGTARLYIPAPSKASRDRAILAGVAAGDDYATVAARVGVHTRTVMRVHQRHQQRRSLAPSEWEL